MAMTGTVTNVESRTATTKFGVKPVYDVYVDGNKFGWGFKDPAKSMVTVGASISFDFTSDKYGQKITESTVKVLSAGTGAVATPVATTAKAAPSSGGGWKDVGFPIPVLSEKISICRQNALTNARELVEEFPAIFFGDKDYDGDDMIAKILEVARAFADYTTGRDATRAVEEMTSKMDKE